MSLISSGTDVNTCQKPKPRCISTEITQVKKNLSLVIFLFIEQIKLHEKFLSLIFDNDAEIKPQPSCLPLSTSILLQLSTHLLDSRFCTKFILYWNTTSQFQSYFDTHFYLNHSRSRAPTQTLNAIQSNLSGVLCTVQDHSGTVLGRQTGVSTGENITLQNGRKK